MKVVINTTYGGFHLSTKAQKLLRLDDPFAIKDNIEARSDPKLVKAVESLGAEAGAYLKVINIPDDAINPYLCEYDGLEWIAEGRI